MEPVTIYTTPTCSYCRMAKEFFTEHGVPYTEKNVLVDMAAREEMIQKSNQRRVPVFVIGGEVLVGFTESKELLKERLQLI